MIASVLGGCPINLAYTIPIPSTLPSAKKALFAWSWFNQLGNRCAPFRCLLLFTSLTDVRSENYMNCAVVDIAGSSSSSFTGPALFRANTLADGTCIVPEGTAVRSLSPSSTPARS